MKKIIFAAVTLIFSVSMLAQAPQRGERREFKPEDMATRITDGMKKALDLNDKQYKSVFKLYLKQGEEMKARREKEQGQQIDREARREEMKKSQEAMDLFGDWLVPSTLLLSSFLFTIYFKESMVSSVMNHLQDRDELVKK